MSHQKDFFIRMCEMENVTPQELQKLTKKSKSVVYDWLNYSNECSFPSYESLSKIVCRLGITIDELLKCKSSKLIDFQNYRIYNEYIIGDLMSFHINEDILKNPSYEYIMNCFVNDCNQLKNMIDNYVLGMNIDEKEFDMLCKHIQPVVISDVEYAFDDYGGVVYLLNSKTIIDYKDRTELFKDRVENDNDYALSCLHKIMFPNANKILLLIANNNINILKKHVLFIDEHEIEMLMKEYLKIAVTNSNYDKKHAIFKLLYNKNCKTEDLFDDLSNPSYHDLLNKYKEKQEIIEDKRNKLFVKIAEYVVSLETISIIELQRQFKISFNIASEMIKRLENANVISSLSDNCTRKVLMNITDLINNKIIKN